MDANPIFQKTPLGMREVNARSLKLAPKLRTMLILVDGTASTALLREKAQLIGAPADFLEQLVKAGLISGTVGAHVSSNASMTT